MPQTKPASHFGTTRWTMIARASDHTSDDHSAALQQLCERYHPAVVSYLRRRTGRPADADDLAQQFFVYVLSRDILKKAERGRGKFRQFLLTCLNNFAANEFERSRAMKRGGHIEFAKFEEQEIRNDGPSPDDAFDQRWAETVLEQALLKVELQWREQGKDFENLKEYLVGPKGATPIIAKARELKISTAALKSSIYRLRQSYGLAVREVVGDTIGEHQSVEEELNYLLAILAS